MPTPSPTAAPPSDAWAEVRVHDAVMRYRRSGAGRAVLVLRPAGGPDPLWPDLVEALVARFRLIVPELPAGDGTAAWIADFLEGLGVAGVSVIASGPFCMPALELALRDADQLTRVVLVPDGAGAATAIDGALATAGRARSLPLLVVGRGVPEPLALIGRFLESAEVPATG